MDEIFNTHFGGGDDDEFSGNFVGGDDNKFSIDNAEYEASSIYWALKNEDDSKKKYQILRDTPITGSAELGNIADHKIRDGILNGSIIGVARTGNGKKIFYDGGKVREIGEVPQINEVPDVQTYGTDVDKIAKDRLKYLGKKRQYEKQISSI